MLMYLFMLIPQNYVKFESYEIKFGESYAF